MTSSLVQGIVYVHLEGNSMELKDFVGKFTLDAVDYCEDHEGYEEEWSACRFRLDGVTYAVVENPEDGYRSSMDEIKIDKGVTVMKNIFPPVEVLGVCVDDEIVKFTDCTTGLLVLELGTDYSDDYYPSFVASFRPESMVINA